MQQLKVAALVCIGACILALAGAEDPYRFFNWNVTYGDIYPLGARQRGILINGQFPGPDIHSVTNDNLIINVFNSLDEPFLLSWNLWRFFGRIFVHGFKVKKAPPIVHNLKYKRAFNGGYRETVTFVF